MRSGTASDEVLRYGHFIKAGNAALSVLKGVSIGASQAPTSISFLAHYNKVMKGQHGEEDTARKPDVVMAFEDVIAGLNSSPKAKTMVPDQALDWEDCMTTFEFKAYKKRILTYEDWKGKLRTYEKEIGLVPVDHLRLVRIQAKRDQEASIRAKAEEEAKKAMAAEAEAARRMRDSEVDLAKMEPEGEFPEIDTRAIYSPSPDVVSSGSNRPKRKADDTLPSYQDSKKPNTSQTAPSSLSFIHDHFSMSTVLSHKDEDRIGVCFKHASEAAVQLGDYAAEALYNAFGRYQFHGFLVNGELPPCRSLSGTHLT